MTFTIFTYITCTYLRFHNFQSHHIFSQLLKFFLLSFFLCNQVLYVVNWSLQYSRFADLLWAETVTGWWCLAWWHKSLQLVISFLYGIASFLLGMCVSLAPTVLEVGRCRAGANRAIRVLIVCRQCSVTLMIWENDVGENGFNRDN